MKIRALTQHKETSFQCASRQCRHTARSVALPVFK